MSAEIIAPDPLIAASHSRSLRRRIEKLTNAGRLTDEVKLLLLAEIHTYEVTRLIAIDQGMDLEKLLGEDWVKSKQDVVDLAELGKYDREFDDEEDED